MEKSFFKNGSTTPLTVDQIINIVTGGYFKYTDDDFHSIFYIKEIFKDDTSDDILKCKIDDMWYVENDNKFRWGGSRDIIEYYPIYSIIDNTIYIPILKKEFDDFKKELKNKI